MVGDGADLSFDHPKSRVDLNPARLGGAQQRGDFGLRDHLGHGHAGVQQGRIQRQRIAVLQPERGCVDDQLPGLRQRITCAGDVPPKVGVHLDGQRLGLVARSVGHDDLRRPGLGQGKGNGHRRAARADHEAAPPLDADAGSAQPAHEARAVELLDRVGLPFPEARMKQYPHQLSGGQRQRVLIAMALACDPDLLIADEPTTALDATVKNQILDLIAGLVAERNMALILISHDLAIVQKATRQMMVMYGGDVVERGPTADILAQPAHPYTIGLLGARPDPSKVLGLGGGKRPRLATIPGTVPDLQDLPAGCRFFGRCDRGDEQCGARPALTPALNDPAHLAACVHMAGTGASS